VLVRWSRSDEMTWAPLSPAMTATVAARLADGRIDGWAYDVWSTGHTSRPGYADSPGLLALQHLATPTAFPAPTDPPYQRGGGTTRNALPGYDVGPRRVTGHRLTGTPLRTSAMRSLGAYLNVFAIESFLDELALEAGVDPVEFRLRHLTDERSRRVVELAAERADWGGPLPDDVGRGIGFARYKDRGAFCAVVAEAALTHEVSVRRLTVAADLGTVVNPDGARNQLEGGAVQATSWTVAERVRFDRRRILSADWESYPILRFPAVPSVEAHLVESQEPPLGAGEAAQGPTAAAIANAVAAALGVRVKDLPLDADAIVRAIEQSE
jgi:CO/xanthine dehydrogenase Mo-binding subunit